jgi:hypothetical protein
MTSVYLGAQLSAELASEPCTIAQIFALSSGQENEVGLRRMVHDSQCMTPLIEQGCSLAAS